MAESVEEFMKRKAGAKPRRRIAVTGLLRPATRQRLQDQWNAEVRAAKVAVSAGNRSRAEVELERLIKLHYPG